MFSVQCSEKQWILEQCWRRSVQKHWKMRWIFSFYFSFKSIINKKIFWLISCFNCFPNFFEKSGQSWQSVNKWLLKRNSVSTIWSRSIMRRWISFKGVILLLPSITIWGWNSFIRFFIQFYLLICSNRKSGSYPGRRACWTQFVRKFKREIEESTRRLCGIKKSNYSPIGAIEATSRWKDRKIAQIARIRKFSRKNIFKQVLLMKIMIFCNFYRIRVILTKSSKQSDVKTKI